MQWPEASPYPCGFQVIDRDNETRVNMAARNSESLFPVFHFIPYRLRLLGRVRLLRKFYCQE